VERTAGAVVLGRRSEREGSDSEGERGGLRETGEDVAFESAAPFAPLPPCLSEEIGIFGEDGRQHGGVSETETAAGRGKGRKRKREREREREKEGE